MVSCAVCRYEVEPDEDHMEVVVTRRQMRDRDHEHEYFLHDRCAANVIGSWEEP